MVGFCVFGLWPIGCCCVDSCLWRGGISVCVCVRESVWLCCCVLLCVLWLRDSKELSDCDVCFCVVRFRLFCVVNFYGFFRL